MKQTLINLSLVALALAGCTQTDLIDTNAGTKGMIDYALYTGRPTRATALDNTNFAKFKIYSYQNIEDTDAPGTFNFSAYYDETVEKSGSNVWAGPRPRRWPTGANDFLNFYAYSDEVNTSAFAAATATTAHPTFKYTVPADVTKQEDLLVASSFNQTEKTNQGKLNMDFKHALTQVVFKVKSASPSFMVKVSKVELIGANSEGTFAYDATTAVGGWSGQTTAADYAFTVETPTKLDDQEFVTLTAAAGNLMMLPNADPKTIKIRVTYTLDDEVDELIKEIKLEAESATAGPNQPPVSPVTPWVMGKRIAYNLTLPGKANEIIFGDATVTEDWDTEQETNTEAKDIFGVSFISTDGFRNSNAGFPLEINDNRQTAGKFSMSSDAAWVKFSEVDNDYANAQNTLTDVAPATRAIIAKKVYVYADNNTTGAQRTATITMTRTDYSTVTLQLIQEAAVANLLGANTYIITNAGNYALDATVKGNGKQVKLPVGYDAVTNPATDIPLTTAELQITGATKAEVLWETTNTASAPAVGTIVKNVSYANGVVFFTTTATQGNAVIVVKNASNKVLWSWHIWRTNTEPQALEMKPLTATTGTFDATGTNTLSGVKIMDRNLGALDATPQSDLSAGLSYQWGRPVPFPGTSSLAIGTTTYMATAGTPITTAAGGSSITVEKGMENPTTFYTNNGDWTSRNDNLWGTPLTSTLMFNTATHSSNAGHKTIYDPCPKGWRIAPSYVYANALSSNGGAFSKGYSFSILTSESLWVPAAGSYELASSVGNSGFYWATSIAPAKVDQANKLYIDKTTAAPEFYDLRACGFSCRCIKE